MAAGQGVVRNGPAGDPAFTAFAIAIAVIVGLTLIVGLLSPPNNIDSLRYHLPRIEQWIQQGSFVNFPTSDTRQLSSNPLAEMLILHFRLLAESDRFDNLVQGLSFAGCITIAAVIARRLGAPRIGQILAALLVATLPMAILEGSSTQNDLVVSFFVLAAAERLLAWRASGRVSDGLGVGCAVGLAILTKGTAFIYAAPIGLGVLAIIIAKRRWKEVGVGAGIVILILVINAAHFYRNAQVIFAPSGLVDRTASLDHSPSAIASSLLRNIGSNFVTPSARINDALVDGIDRIHRVIGMDINDPDTTLAHTRFADLPRNVVGGDSAPNPLHVLLVFLAVAMLGLTLVRGAGRSTLPAAVWPYFAMVIAGGVLFCALLRWQPWITRLQLTFFILAAPALATIMVARFGRSWLLATGTCLIVAAVPFVIANQERPLYGNPVRMFANHFAPNIASASPWQILSWDNPKRYYAIRDAVDAIGDRASAGVGLLVDGNEYVFWRMLKGERFRRPVHIELACLPADHVNLYRPSTFRPAFLLTDQRQPPVLECASGVFDRQASFPTGDSPPNAHISVYRRRLSE
ncbi:hypothetical protein AYO42_03165 [Rhizomicrobium sp. SCGC AG-212-E05]|nr:hypothetical protein AYO42_03165 [Rhizomicrobium sp. SCGC AG-212-E05]